MSTKLPFEPYKIKAVERIRISTEEERLLAAEAAAFNLYDVSSSLVLIDLLTDSGTGALSTEQRSAMMRADESYAGNRSIRKLQQCIEDLFGLTSVFPTHQGRAAERILVSTLCSPGDVVLSNTHFDTTKANLTAAGVQALDLPNPASADLFAPQPFKGNMDLQALRAKLEEQSSRIPFVTLTITNNSCADQPVSMQNIRETAALVNSFGIPLYLDACRFAQNAWFIRNFEPGYESTPIRFIVREMFHYADGFFLSAKKDGLSPMGGLLGTRNPAVALKFREAILLSEGHPSYGGLAGEHLEAMAVGFEEATEEDYLAHHTAFTHYLGSKLSEAGIPVVQPIGSHAVFLDTKTFLPHFSPEDQPGQALAIELFVRFGIRSTKMSFGAGSITPDGFEFLRLAIPSRVYTQSHMDYVIDAFLQLYTQRYAIRPLALLSSPKMLSGFSACYSRPAPMLVRAACAEK